MRMTNDTYEWVMAGMIRTHEPTNPSVRTGAVARVYRCACAKCVRAWVRVCSVWCVVVAASACVYRERSLRTCESRRERKRVRKSETEKESAGEKERERETERDMNGKDVRTCEQKRGSE